MQAIVPVDHASDVSAETRMIVTTVHYAHASGAAAADTHALGEAIASLAAGIHAATYRLLTLLRAFDEREGWNNGFVSCAHWLHSTPTRNVRASGAPAWRTGIDLGASREKVRVARALAALPRISWAMEHGALSYAKVRAPDAGGDGRERIRAAGCGGVRHRRALGAIRAGLASRGPRV